MVKYQPRELSVVSHSYSQMECMAMLTPRHTEQPWGNKGLRSPEQASALYKQTVNLLGIMQLLFQQQSLHISKKKMKVKKKTEIYCF